MSEQLSVFLARERAKGTPTREIMNDLLANGFTRSEIEGAMAQMPLPPPRPRRLLPAFGVLLLSLLVLMLTLR